MAHFQKKVVVIVDAYSTGKYYAPAFLGHGYPCIHINSNLPINKKIAGSINKSYFIKEIQLDDEKNISDVVEQLRKYDIKAIVTGSEVGLITSEAIAAHFDLPSNDLSMGLVRRDKYLMIEALAKNNIPCAQQIKSNKLDDLLNWYQNSNFKKVVLKPALGTLSEGVSLCKNRVEIQTNFQKHYNKVNITGYTNNEFVLQECLEGDEYIVNTVSCNNQHFITDIWKGIGGLKDQISTDQYAELLKRDSEIFQILSDYTIKVLEAVGIKNSPGHSEIKLTSEGPKLIEIGARLTGGWDFSVMNEAMGYSQLSVSVESILNPDNFNDFIKQLNFSKQKFCRFVYFCSYIEGKILHDPDFSPLMAIDSVMAIISSIQTGDYLTKTNETLGRPGYAMLLSETEEQLENDYKKFRILEDNLYKDIIKK